MFEKTKAFFKSVKEKLSKTSDTLTSSIVQVFKAKIKIDDKVLDDLRESLILADVSYNSSERIISNFKNKMKGYETEKEVNKELYLGLLQKEIQLMLTMDDSEININSKDISVIMVSGVNGSGKTTLFNCISGILPLTEGRVWVAGQEVTGLDPWRINRHGLGRTFQRLRIFGKQTVYDNMLLARKWKGVPAWLWLTVVPHDIQQKANELLDFLQIDHVKNNQGNNLSGGQQRLLEIGMTLMCDPEIVLLDEATSGVNPTLIEDIKDSIRHLNRVKGVTFLLIEHNMVFTMDLCDRLYVLDYGSLIASGTPEEIQNNDKVIEAYFGRDE